MNTNKNNAKKINKLDFNEQFKKNESDIQAIYVNTSKLQKNILEQSKQINDVHKTIAIFMGETKKHIQNLADNQNKIIENSNSKFKALENKINSINNLIIKKEDNLIIKKEDNLIIKKKDNLSIENEDNLIIKKEDNLIIKKEDNLITKKSCFNFNTEKGCNFGENCRFLHSKEEKKKNKCKYFNEAKGCKFVDNCNNIHIKEKSIILEKGIISEKEQIFLKNK
jgi:hypothetical protein